MNTVDFTERKTYSTYPQNVQIKKKLLSVKGILLMCLVTCAIILVIFTAIEIVPVLQKPPQDSKVKGRTQEVTGAEYNAVLENLRLQRTELLAKYRDASGSNAQREVLHQAAQIFFYAVSAEIIPSWYGTGWDFNGTTQIPGNGKIACGYFVTTVLRDTGLKIERAVLAQQASECIIKSLVAEKNIRRFSNVEGTAFLEQLTVLEPGLYVLGLDKHVGFLMIESNAQYFIHSSYLRPFCVTKEPAAESRALMSSGYRVLGNLLADESLLLKWLGQEKIPTKKQ
jgi:hypothetical protein